ncbi:hypothetical protein AB2F28_06840 [Escherichia coli]
MNAPVRSSSASVVLWELDLTEVGGERDAFGNEQNEKGEPVTWQGRRYQAYPIQGSGFELEWQKAPVRAPRRRFLTCVRMVARDGGRSGRVWSA